LYTDEEIRQLLDAAKSMSAQFPLHRSTYHCLLGLLAVSGMRISEALNLELRDIDWMEALLTIRSTKFGKSRLVPLHPTAKIVLSDYVSLRNKIFSDRPTSAFFPSKTGARLDEGQVRRVFYRLSRQVGIRGALAGRGPRLHDFRQNAEFLKMPNHTLESAGSDWNGRIWRYLLVCATRHYFLSFLSVL
jgi:integrase